MNVDLGFVPASHAPAEPVPAVSGSSGRLLVSRPKAAKGDRRWPGQVFEREELSYTAAMEQFVAARLAKDAQKGNGTGTKGEAVEDEKARRLALRSEMRRLQIARREEREKRRLIDRAWKARQREHKENLATLSAEKGGGQKRVGSRSALGRKRGEQKAQRRAEWAERHRELARRRENDQRWREERNRLRQRQQECGAAVVSAWIAVLVIVDNCTRRCLGLPLFEMGAHVTAQLVVTALEQLLPKELKYLIADGGAHFTADVMQKLAEGQGFVRVPLARHRPESNGVAERFVETLKQWLSNKEWQGGEELAPLLPDFVAYYNDRPHQGRELAGLSPNEYALRMLAA